LITSAPWSARVRVHIGPTTTEVWSITRMPSSGPPAKSCSSGLRC